MSFNFHPGNKNSRSPISDQGTWPLSTTSIEDRLRHASGPVHIWFRYIAWHFLRVRFQLSEHLSTFELRCHGFNSQWIPSWLSCCFYTCIIWGWWNRVHARSELTGTWYVRKLALSVYMYYVYGNKPVKVFLQKKILKADWPL